MLQNRSTSISPNPDQFHKKRYTFCYNYTNCVCFLSSVLGHHNAIETGVFSKPLEFEGFKQTEISGYSHFILK